MRHRLLAGLGLALACAHPAPADATSRFVQDPYPSTYRPLPAAPVLISHATVLDGAVIRKHGFLGAGAVLTPGKEMGEGEMWLGSPAKFARRLSDAEIEALYYSAGHYVRLKDEYLAATAGA